MNWISCWVSLAFQRTGSHTVQLWRSFHLGVGASRPLCYGMSASRFSALESTSRVVCAQGRRCVCVCAWPLGRHESEDTGALAPRPWVLDCSEAVPGIYAPFFTFQSFLLKQTLHIVISLKLARTGEVCEKCCVLQLTKKQKKKLCPAFGLRLYFIFQETLTDWRLCHF